MGFNSAFKGLKTKNVLFQFFISHATLQNETPQKFLRTGKCSLEQISERIVCFMIVLANVARYVNCLDRAVQAHQF
jgi:hypothetical protein